MSNSIADFRGDVVYLDTTAFYLFLRAVTPEAHVLFQNIERGVYRAYTSVLAFDELTYRMLLAMIRDAYPGSPLDHLRQNQDNMIKEFYPQVDSQLARLQSFPNLTLLDVTRADLDAMRQNISKYKLRPRDALHLAAMQKVKCFVLISQDGDFDAIAGVERYQLDASRV